MKLANILVLIMLIWQLAACQNTDPDLDSGNQSVDNINPRPNNETSNNRENIDNTDNDKNASELATNNDIPNNENNRTQSNDTNDRTQKNITPLEEMTAFVKQSKTLSKGQRPYWVYEVLITGTSQGQYFQRKGALMITQAVGGGVTTNDVNVFDIVLKSGEPAASPESGAIWFMTNNAWVGSQSALDMAYVKFDSRNSYFEVSPDPNLSSIGVNVFNAYSGMLADMYQIFDGTMGLTSEDGYQTLSGEINILGTGALFHSNTPYIATLSGKLFDSGTW